MKKRTIPKLAAALICTVLVSAAGVYSKVEFDFPACKTGRQQLQAATSVAVASPRVFVRHTGWEDTQSYFRFKATLQEIDRMVEVRQLTQVNKFNRRSSFYWWKPEVDEKSQCFQNKKGQEWSWLHHNPVTGDTHLFTTTF
jgi:hypothetical protein